MAQRDFIVDSKGRIVRNPAVWKQPGGAAGDTYLQGVPGAPGVMPGAPARPWVSVKWECCGAYNRVYRNQQGTAYEGTCPRCGRRATARVGPGGTTNRFFVAE